MKPVILFVDDETSLLKGLRRMLISKSADWKMLFADSGTKGLDVLAEHGIDVVVSDMRMPGMDGVAFLKEVKKRQPTAVRLMLTGNTDQETAIHAVNEGHIFRFLNKPCEPDTLIASLEAAVEQYRLVTAEKELLSKTLSGSVKLLTDILVMTEASSFRRGVWLRDSVRAAIRHLEDDKKWEAPLAAMLSHIGYVTLPQELARVLNERGTQGLSEREREIVERLPEVGFKLLRNIPRLEGVARIVLYQNKNFDGSGFPIDGTKGKEIPLGARLLKILLDAEEKVQAGHSLLKIRQLFKNQGKYYDTDLVDTAFHFFVPPQAEPSAQPKAVTAGTLAIGHKLYANLTSAKGDLIVSAGNYITPTLMERIQTTHDLYGLSEPIMIYPPLPGHVLAQVAVDTSGS